MKLSARDIFPIFWSRKKRKSEKDECSFAILDTHSKAYFQLRLNSDVNLFCLKEGETDGEKTSRKEIRFQFSYQSILKRPRNQSFDGWNELWRLEAEDHEKRWKKYRNEIFIGSRKRMKPIDVKGQRIFPFLVFFSCKHFEGKSAFVIVALDNSSRFISRLTLSSPKTKFIYKLRRCVHEQH